MSEHDTERRRSEGFGIGWHRPVNSRVVHQQLPALHDLDVEPSGVDHAALSQRRAVPALVWVSEAVNRPECDEVVFFVIT